MPENNKNNEDANDQLYKSMENRIKEVADHSNKLIAHFKWSIGIFLSVLSVLAAGITLVIGFGAPQWQWIESIAEDKVAIIAKELVAEEFDRIKKDNILKPI